MGVMEMASFVGKSALLKVESITFPVTINDIRKVWQRIDVLVTPVGGKGEQWVSLDRVQLLA